MVYCAESGLLKSWDALLDKYNQEYSYIPLKCLARLALTQQYLSQFYNPVDQSKLVKRWLEYFDLRVSVISNQEIKDCDIETIKEAINEQQYFFKKGISSDGLDKFIEEKQLTLGLKFLKSPYLEKRVKGVTEIKDILERFDTTKRRMLQKDYLVKWLMENQILEMLLLGDSVHPELIKRAGEICVFLCRNNMFQSEMIDKIWQQSEGKHETIQLAVYDLLRQVSPHMNLEMVNRLYSHIEKIKYQDYKEQTIQLVKSFTDHALSRKIQQQIQTNDTRRFFGFNQLWELLQDREQNIVQPHIQELAFNLARAIVSQINQTKQFLHYFFAKCFDLIKEHRSVYQAISFSHYILDKQFIDDQQGKKQLIKVTNEKYQIIELFVKEIEVYLEKIREHFKDQETQDIVIWGVQTFQQNMFFRLQMLNYLLQHQELKITYEQLVRLWTACTVKTKGTIQKKELTKVLQSGSIETQVQLQNRFFSEKDSQIKFFLEVLCNPASSDYVNFSSEEFELFQVFFRQYNVNKNFFKCGPSNSICGKIRVKDFDFAGKDALWNLFKLCENNTQPVFKGLSTQDSIAQLLVTLHTSLHSSIQSKTQQIHQELMDRCLDLLSVNSSPQLASRCINLILLLFNVFQTGHFTTPKKVQNKQPNILFKATIKGQVQEFKESDSTTFDQFKRKLAEEYKVAYKQIEILVDNNNIEQDNDITELLLPHRLQISNVKINFNISYHPRNYLSQNDSTLSLLFSLLKTNAPFTLQVWELLNQLPTNKEIQEGVLTFQKQLDEKTDVYKSMYIGQIILQQTENAVWKQQFIEQDQVQILVQKYLNNWQGVLQRSYTLIFSQLLNIYLNKEPKFLNSDIQAKAYSVLSDLVKDPGSKTEAKLLDEQFLLLKLFPEGANFFINQPDLISKLQVLLVDNDNNQLKIDLVKYLLETHSPLLAQTLTGPLLEWVITQNKQRSEQFFELIYEIFNQVPNIESLNINYDKLILQLITTLSILPIIEKTHKIQDQVLIGVLKVLQILCHRFEGLKEKIGVKLLPNILDALIEINNNTLEKKEIVGPLCKSSQSRQTAFNCLQTLITANENLAKLIEFIKPLHLTPVWRTKSYVDWNIQSKFNEKSSTGYVGLQNLACICYQNSLIQQLFMIPEFRDNLLKVEDMTDPSVSEEDNMFYQLKCQMTALLYSQKQYHNPKKFCHAFKDFEGNPTNIFEQMDVDEFSNLLMDRIEQAIKGSSQEDLVKRYFGGVISNEIICKTCPHYSEREEPFFSVSLPVKNKKNIESSLQTLIDGDILEGDNAYHCEICDKKVSANKRTCLKKLPNHLILVLKRFDFDFDLMQKSKINDKCEFPYDLDLMQFSQQGLKKAENRFKESDTEYEDSYFKYQLRGVVIHIGSADSGHYYSFIKDREKEDRWYEFNDIFISNCEYKDVVNQGFGGNDKSYQKSKMISQFKDKTKNAYLLFYDRIKKFDYQLQQTPQLTKENSNNKQQIRQQQQEEQDQIKQQQEKQDQLKKFMNELQNENKCFQIQRFIFNPEYFHFIQQLISNYQSNSSTDIELGKTLIQFFMVCALRDSDRSFLINNISSIKSILSNSIPISSWFLTAFTMPQYIKEYQFECPNKMVRKLVITLLETAMITVGKSEGYQKIFEVNSQEQPASIITSVMNQWIKMIKEIQSSARYYSEYFDLFYRFACISKEYTQYLLSKRIIGKLLDFYIDFILNNQIKKNLANQQKEIRKLDDIRIQENQEFSNYFGYQNEQAKEAAQHYDELLEKKFEKNFNMSYQSSRMYLWRTVGYLLNQCKLGGDQKRQYQLTQDEIELLFVDTHFYGQLLEEGDSKLAIRCISDILCMLSYDNLKSTEQIIEAIKKQIMEKEYREYRKYFVPLKKILQLSDSLQIQRINQAMNILLQQCIQKQLQYFFETDISQQYIIRIVNRNPLVLKWMQNNVKTWAFLMDSINNQVVPNEKLMMNNVNSSKCLHRLHSIYLPPTQSPYKKLISWKKMVYTNIHKQEPLNVPSTDFDSDDDLTDATLNPQEKIDYQQHQLIFQISLVLLNKIYGSLQSSRK